MHQMRDYARWEQKSSYKSSQEALRSTFRNSLPTSMRSSIPINMEPCRLSIRQESSVNSFRGPISLGDLKRCPTVFQQLHQGFIQIEEKIKRATLQLTNRNQEEEMCEEEESIETVRIIESLDASEHSMGEESSETNEESDRLAFLRSKGMVGTNVSNRQYYIGPLIKKGEDICSRRKEHIKATQIALQMYMSLRKPTDAQLKKKVKRLSQRDPHKKTLVVDLDETILHCAEKKNSSTDIQIVYGEGNVIYMSLRPYALSFLREMAKIYELIIYTASLQSYADAVLDQIDPNRTLFHHRLYRSDCLFMERGLYIKDLRIINREEKNIVILDNSIYSSIFQIDNAVPILSYYSGEDTELLFAEKYLKQLALWEDVRVCNRLTFRIAEYPKESGPYSVVLALYVGNDFTHLEKYNSKKINK